MKEEIYRSLSGEDRQKRAAAMLEVEEMARSGSLVHVECQKVAGMVLTSLKNERNRTSQLQLLGFGMIISDRLCGFEGSCYSSIFLLAYYSKTPEISKTSDAQASALILGNAFKARLGEKAQNTELANRIENVLLFSAENSFGIIKQNAIESLRYSNNPKVWKALGKIIDANPKSTDATLAKESLRMAGERTEISTGIFAKPAPWFRPIEVMDKMRRRRQLMPALAAL